MLFVVRFVVHIAVFIVFNRLLIIFFCHLSIAVLCPPIDWTVIRNHS